MKALGIFAVLGVLALAGMIMFGGFLGLDPAEQAQAFREQVNEGMTWEQVADVREPREFVSINPNSLSGEGMSRDFQRDRMGDLVADNEQLRHGFIFKYRFDATHHYDVVFSSAGDVVTINEPRTARDLYEGQLFTR